MTNEQASQPTFLGRYAGFVTRLVAFVIDRAIVAIIVFIAVWAIEWLMNAFEINVRLLAEGERWQIPLVLGAGIYLGVRLIYDIGFWLLAGQTPGKRVLGVRIVRTDGKRLNLWNALRRVIGYIVSSILFLGYLWILFDNRRQGFHDKLAGTMVVYSWPEDELKGTFVRDKVEHIRHRQRARRESEGTGS